MKETKMPSGSGDSAELTVENVRLLPTADLEAVIADLLPLLLAARQELERRCPGAELGTVH